MVDNWNGDLALHKFMVKTLPHGVYRIWFVDHRRETPVLASVGSTHDGTRWYAPCNWTSADNEHPVVASTDWKIVQRVELLAEDGEELTIEEHESERMRKLTENAASEGLRRP